MQNPGRIAPRERWRLLEIDDGWISLAAPATIALARPNT